MKQEFRVTIEAEGKAPAEEFLNTLKKISDRAEAEYGIRVNVERLKTTDVEEPSFSRGAEYGD